jgi:hypothetical protein
MFIGKIEGEFAVWMDDLVDPVRVDLPRQPKTKTTTKSR